MNKEQFLRDLRVTLSGLSPEELENAIQYYEEYFAEAGPDREAEILRELGSPQAVAAQIRVDITLRGMDGPTPPSAKKGISAVWLVVLAIFAAPIALPLAIALAITALALVVAVAAVLLAIFLVVVVLVGCGILVGLYAFHLFQVSAAAGLICLGAGMAMTGCSLLMVVLMILCARMGFRGVAYLLNRVTQKKRRKRA